MGKFDKIIGAHGLSAGVMFFRVAFCLLFRRIFAPLCRSLLGFVLRLVFASLFCSVFGRFLVGPGSPGRSNIDEIHVFL